MNIYTTLALGLLGALLTAGALYRLTPTETWPPALRWVGATAWYGVAAIGAVLVYAFTLGRRSPSPRPDESSDGGKSEPSDDSHDPSPDDYERPPVNEPESTPSAPDGGDGEADLEYWSNE